MDAALIETKLNENQKTNRQINQTDSSIPSWRQMSNQHFPAAALKGCFYQRKEKLNYKCYSWSTVVGLLVLSFTKVYPRFNKIAVRDKLSLQEVIRLIQLLFGYYQFVFLPVVW